MDPFLKNFLATFFNQVNHNGGTVVLITYRSSHPEVFLEKVVLKIYSKFTGEHPCRSAISIRLFCNFIEIALRRGCCPVNLLHILEHLSA